MTMISGVSPPSTATIGTRYYDQNTHQIYTYDGQFWIKEEFVTISKGFTIIVDKEMLQYIDELREI